MRTGSRTLLSLERQPTMFAFLSVSPEHPSTGLEGRCSESARCHWMKAPTAPKRPKLAMKNNAYRDGTQHHSNYLIIYILLELVIKPASPRWTLSGIAVHVVRTVPPCRIDVGGNRAHLSGRQMDSVEITLTDTLDRPMSSILTTEIL